jgi:hypothetical protein
MIAWDRVLVPFPDLPGYVHGIVSLEPPKVQCDGCGLVASGACLSVLILTAGIKFDPKGGPGWERRRLCAECRGEVSATPKTNERRRHALVQG